MTLHPWPLNDTSDDTGDHTAVLWTGHRGRGLLSDSLAIPLRFMPETPHPTPVIPTLIEPARASIPAFPSFDSSALLHLRDIGCRFGTCA